MGRSSTIHQLPEDQREQLDAMVRDGRATIDEMVAHLTSLGAEVSRSAVGRYSQAMEQRMQRYREAQAVAGVWLKEVDLGSSDLGRMLGEMAKTMAFQTMAQLGDTDDGAAPQELMLIAKALKDLESAAKTNLETRAKIRAELKAEMADRVAAAQDAVSQVAVTAGLSDAHAQHLREIVLGVVS